jgi:predicted nucleic acid-binding protein
MGRLNLSGGHRVYLDTNVLIHLVEGLSSHAAELDMLIDAIDRGGVVCATSELSLAEVLVKPLATGNTALTQQYHELIGTQSRLEVLTITRSILVSAADARTTYGVKLPDAIHMASALSFGCTYFLSQDKDFQSTTYPGVVTLIDLDP